MSPAPRRLAASLGLTLALLGGCNAADDAGQGGRSEPLATALATPASIAASGSLERYDGYQSREYDDPAHWLCRPDQRDDACDVDLDATVIAPDGSSQVQEFEPDPEAPVDCFYVYPTVSRDLSPTSDWSPGETEERFVAVNQAARLGSVCRVFAPMYRQVTLAALTGGADLGGAGAADPYADVLDAFRTYMARDNQGRGLVLVGHSQGTLWLTRLLREEVDPNADVRGLLVGAYLAGGRLGVPRGELVGGDLKEIPLCVDEGEHGCVTTWSSVLPAATPLPSSSGPDSVACVDPAGVGGSDTTQPYFTTDLARAMGRAVDGDAAVWPDPAFTSIDTLMVQLPGRFRTSCRSEPGGQRLEVTWTEDPAESRTLPGARGADLHLLDISLVMGDVVDQVRRQATTFSVPPTDD